MIPVSSSPPPPPIQESSLQTFIETSPCDTIVKSVVEKFEQRSRLGMQKYGTTLDRTDLSTLDWTNHVQEELMDAILYLERLKRDIQPKCV